MLSKEKKYPIICEIERIAIVKELRCVDEVVVQDNMDKLQAVIKYNVDVVLLDRIGKVQRPGIIMKRSLLRWDARLFI